MNTVHIVIEKCHLMDVCVPILVAATMRIMQDVNLNTCVVMKKKIKVKGVVDIFLAVRIKNFQLEMIMFGCLLVVQENALDVINL